VSTGGHEDLRRVELPGARTLRIRALSAADAAGLVELFATLGEDDLYRRFFSGHPPPETFVKKMAGIEERGGIGLVAVLEGPDDSARIVGEASSNPLPNGNGELGITVAPEARGWLGPYLLDALVEEAARRGVPNIEADVLVTNRRMLTLLHHRGYAVMDESDHPVILRVRISTTGRVAGWEGGQSRPRVLVEAPGGHWSNAEQVRKAGFEVLVCPGPLRGWSACPALRGEPCPLAAHADAIVDAVPGEPGSALLAAHRRLHPAVPVCVELLHGTTESSGVPTFRAGAEGALVIELLERLASGSTGPPEPGSERRG
jgi:ribosomal protein S18 acetylase RimI-like enzyme